MSCKVPVIVANTAFEEGFGQYDNKLIFKHGDPADLADKMQAVMDNEPDGLRDFLRDQVLDRHNVDNLISKMLKIF